MLSFAELFIFKKDLLDYNKISICLVLEFQYFNILYVLLNWLFHYYFSQKCNFNIICITFVTWYMFINSYRNAVFMKLS